MQIDKLKRYSDDEVFKGKNKKIINWCWGSGGVNFSQIIRYFLKNFESFDKKYYHKLFSDIERLCDEHDLDFYYKKWFKKSNFIFAFWVFKLIKSWTKFSERFVIFIVIFYLLNKYWKKYYEKSM